MLLASLNVYGPSYLLLNFPWTSRTLELNKRTLSLRWKCFSLMHLSCQRMVPSLYNLALWYAFSRISSSSLICIFLLIPVACKSRFIFLIAQWALYSNSTRPREAVCDPLDPYLRPGSGGRAIRSPAMVCRRWRWWLGRGRWSAIPSALTRGQASKAGPSGAPLRLPEVKLMVGPGEVVRDTLGP